MSEKKTDIKTEEVVAESAAAVPAPTPATIPENIRAQLAKYGADDNVMCKIVDDLGVETVEELASMEVSDLTGAGMKLAKARRLLADLKVSDKSAAPAPVAAPVATGAFSQSQFEVLLPSVPTDESWLNALKTGGVLKVDRSSYIAAIRAALADRAGLYNVPEALSKCMEQYADETEEQVDPTFYALRKSLTRRTYGDIFAAIDGLDGQFITEKRRKEFLVRIRENLWPAIAESYRTLDSWYQTYRASCSDPSMFMSVLSGGIGAGAAMMTPPDTSMLHDAGDTLVDSINRVFRGTGVQVAAALAYDANTIRNTLEDSRLPSMIGVRNREMMLKKIGANVSSNYIRLEQNLVKYVLAFTEHDTITSDVEAKYFIAIWQIGTQINWNELGGVDSGIKTNPTMQGSFSSITGKPLL